MCRESRKARLLRAERPNDLRSLPGVAATAEDALFPSPMRETDPAPPPNWNGQPGLALDSSPSRCITTSRGDSPAALSRPSGWPGATCLDGPRRPGSWPPVRLPARPATHPSSPAPAQWHRPIRRRAASVITPEHCATSCRSESRLARPAWSCASAGSPCARKVRPRQRPSRPVAPTPRYVSSAGRCSRSGRPAVDQRRPGGRAAPQPAFA
jgi:hypothetical protein